jgi:Plasma-membrane choline transporter
MTIPIVQGVAVNPQQQQQQSSSSNSGGYYQPARTTDPSLQSNNNSNNSGGGGGFAQALNRPQQQQSHYQTDYNNNSAPTATLLGDGDGDGNGEKFYTHQELAQIRQEQYSGNNNMRQPYQDVIWAIFFYLHLIVVVGLGLYIISSNGSSSSDGSSSVATVGSLSGILTLAGVSGVAAIGLSGVALQFMMRNTTTLCQIALVFSVCTSLAAGVVGFLMGNMLMGIVGIVSFAIGICYAYLVWSRIPFAAANLKTALTAVQCNMGLCHAVALGFALLGFAWSLLWFMGVGSALSQNSLVVVFLLFLSYYWTHQVLANTVHVTSVGVVGTWWFVPDEANAWWSSALTGSLARATTTSFGSICFGSFLVAFVQALRSLEYYTRDNDDMRIVSCIIQCILSCIGTYIVIHILSLLLFLF